MTHPYSPVLVPSAAPFAYLLLSAGARPPTTTAHRPVPPARPAPSARPDDSGEALPRLTRAILACSRIGLNRC
jgi:hypothetical protein